MPRLAANLSFLFQEHDFLARFGAARGAGFHAVECLFPYDTPAEAIRRELAAHALTLVLLNTPPGDWQNGERGLAALPGREVAFNAALDQAIDYARLLGASRVHVMAGVVPVGVSLAACEAVFIANLRRAADALARHGLSATIEPLNSIDVPGYVLSGSRQARRIIEAVARPNLKLQFDAYHLQIMEGDLIASFERHLDIIGHVQIAGVPGRNEPDRGEVDLGFLLARLDELGYQGWISCEYRPRAGTLAGLGWARRYGISGGGTATEQGNTT
jgi:hydroxypyruvate isomerase